MLNEIFSINNQSILLVIGTLIGLLVTYLMVLAFLRRLGKNPKYLMPIAAVKRVSKPIFIIFLSILIRLQALRQVLGLEDYTYWFRKTSALIFIFAFTWLLLSIVKIVKHHIIEKYDVEASHNLKARKVATQFNILERIFVFIIIIIAMGIALMSFESIREIGVSIFASAGVAGIIIGFSAQKMIGTILAGIQIALAQPIKLDDVVIVEGEWGRIEKIMLTYVVIKIWDKRRLIVPTTYFIEKPFQNWTKTSSDILGTVFLYTDYNVPFDAIREEFTRILNGTDLWDGEVNVVQVTDSKLESIEIRALMSAKDSSAVFDLRVLVREKLICFLQENYPESLPRTRLQIEKSDLSENTSEQ
ncbi:Small-conductance mechanosensitive channel [Pricia antarctica]|uniref:Small-conductance mechanosensitive channel n=1 Tax=Pricia antarctica TaxID=641691 RepID=A0A1G6WJ91_9FLAO|nr:mechanosensitive ion channel domain-containing protein [Pricia antarctica]SDD65839.1 Small-conductance mechanosensitive channel [Pricia antarctica]